MSTKSILDLLSKQNEKPVLFFYEGFALKKSLTFQELRSASASLAVGLETLGILGKPVMICLPNCAEFAISYFAVIQAGGIPVPFTTPDYVGRDYFVSLVRHMTAITGAQYCLSFEKELPADLHCLDPRSLQSQPAGRPTSEACNLALIQFSSGSTIEPKGVMLTHENILANLEQIREGMRVRTGDVLCSWLPFYHDMGLIGGLLSVLHNEVEGHFMAPADFIASPGLWLQLVGRTRTSVIMGPNFLYKTLLKRIPSDQRAQYRLNSIRLALSGAEPVQASLCRDFVKGFAEAGLNADVMFPVYGMAENALALSFPDPGQPLRTLIADREALSRGVFRAAPDGVEFVSCGRPLKGSEVRISAPAAGEIGEIQFRSPSMTSGYWNAPELSQGLWTEDGWMRTGDLGFLWKGELLITGRSKDVLIFNGRKFFPQDVEGVTQGLLQYRVGRTAAFSYRVDDQDEYALAVETKEWRPGRRRELRRILSQKSFELTLKAPQSVHLISPCTLPRTSSGKLKRFALKEWRENGQLRRREILFLKDLFFVEVKKMVEIFKYFRKNARVSKLDIPALLGAYLVHVFAEVTRIPQDKIETEKSFFEYQLDSIQIVQLNARLKKDLVEIPLIEFVGIQNLEQLKNYILRNHTQEAEKIRGLSWN